MLNYTCERKVGHCDKVLLQIFFFISTILNTYVPCQISAKYTSGSGKEVAICSNGSNLGYLI